MATAIAFFTRGTRLGSSLSKSRFFCSYQNAIQQQQEEKPQLGGGKSLNLYSAINQALHIALETDSRFVFTNTHMTCFMILILCVELLKDDPCYQKDFENTEFRYIIRERDVISYASLSFKCIF